MVQRCKPDLTDTEIGMSVFGGSLFVLAVVDMENCDLILAEGFVKLVQDEIRICCEIISCVVDSSFFNSASAFSARLSAVSLSFWN